MYVAMLVSPWQLILLLVLALRSLANSNFDDQAGVPTLPIYSFDVGAENPTRLPPPVDRIDGFGHGQDQINGVIAEAGAIQGDACSTGQTKQLSSTEGPGHERNIASRNTAEQSDGHQNGEACRNIGAMSDVQLRPLSDLEEVIQADIIGPEKDPSICEDTQKPIPVCAPDQLTDGQNFVNQIPRCRPCKFNIC